MPKKSPAKSKRTKTPTNHERLDHEEKFAGVESVLDECGADLDRIEAAYGPQLARTPTPADSRPNLTDEGLAGVVNVLYEEWKSVAQPVAADLSP